MSDWRRAANKRRAMRAAREVESDLGPQIPPISPPWRSTYRFEPPIDLVEKIKTALFAVSGFILLGCVLLALFMAALLVTTRPSRGQDAQAIEKQIRSDCRVDALKYCKTAIAKYAVKSAPEGRTDVINCMLANREKLRAACAKYLW